MLGHMLDRVLSRAPAVTVERTTRHQPGTPFHFDAEAGVGGVEEIVARQGPFDCVINAIGMLKSSIDDSDPVSVEKAMLVNAALPQALARLSGRTGIRVIHLSTDAVFPDDAEGCNEDTPVMPTDAYARSKAAGEAVAPDMLVLRCSIVGPDPRGRRGLLERLLSLPRHGSIDGYTNHRWNGVTTLQFAELCVALLSGDTFRRARGEAGIQHFCPNAPTTKYDLLVRLAALFRPDVTVNPRPGPAPVRRILETRYTALRGLFGSGQPMTHALERLAADMSLSTS